ncbi:hypothetical protein [Acetobacterium woodii]|uniref:Transmembrane protein n=1 Tax=Acetobacterium woodii (strain ATCC 29683 / DSM 1030 / JCM 2381 / KCTC 1655 / WB1) TaxID=931626 RepID=H6LF07_ACEWD|nr:hypothetical protein [Acetobacterium woodii]AFA46913.1 hypothetical protein Awo_c01030 [Acetobacterium woodii DSM 1030]
MTEKTKKEIHRLYMSELVTALVCGTLMYLLTDSTGQPLDLRLLLPGGVLIFIVLQSAGYWYYRYQQMDSPYTPMDWVMPLFLLLKKLDLLLFAIYPLYALYLVLFQPDQFFMTMNFFGLILYLFSIIEYYNYYYYSVQIGQIKKKVPSELSLELSHFEKNK